MNPINVLIQLVVTALVVWLHIYIIGLGQLEDSIAKLLRFVVIVVALIYILTRIFGVGL